MTPLRTIPRSLALAGMTTLVSALLASVPAAASCLPLQVPPADAADTVVLVATVRGVDGIRTELDVTRWFLGTGPTDTVVVAGGRATDVITSADWTPAVGEEYVVVAMRTIEGTLETDLCQQQISTPELQSTLLATYGDPESPPFDSPVPSPSPTASDAAEPSASFLPAGASPDAA